MAKSGGIEGSSDCHICTSWGLPLALGSCIQWLRDILIRAMQLLQDREERQPMRTSIGSMALIAMLGITVGICSTEAQAQTMAVIGSPTIALKSGESAELSNLYFVSNCKSLLTSPPAVEILDGPPGVTASIKEEMVMARAQKCAAPVKGGKLFVAAGDIQDQSFSTLTLRITYRTRDGERKLSQLFNLELFP
jgi:hypothetical protein